MCSGVITGVLQSRIKKAQKRAIEKHVAHTVNFKNGKGHQPEHGAVYSLGKSRKKLFPRASRRNMAVPRS